MMIRYGDNELLECKVTAQPAVEPVTTAQIKTILAIPASENNWDEYIERLIRSARVYAERYTNLSFITQTRIAFWTQYAEEVSIPYGPVQSISEVQIDGATTTDYQEYGLDFKTIYPGVRLNLLGYKRTLKVTYVAGYGATAADVPDIIKEAIEKQAATAFENRRKYNEELPSGLTNEVKGLLDSVSKRTFL